MKLSQLIDQLQTILDEYGDLSIQLFSSGYQESSLPPGAMGGGGGGYGTKWHGTVRKIQVSEKYSDHLEIHGTT